MAADPETVKERAKPVSTGDFYIELPYQNYMDGDRPAASWKLGADNFVKQGKTIFVQLGETVGLIPKDPLRPPFCLGLVLSNEAVKEAERRREATGGRVDAHPVSRGLYDLGCLFLDNLFDGRPIQRFWFLEIIARIPYFSYVSMLHLYESFGWWRAPELRKVHSAEEWNELHHLLIMETLGGNSQVRGARPGRIPVWMRATMMSPFAGYGRRLMPSSIPPA
jgi:ubiquinol oxidase